MFKALQELASKSTLLISIAPEGDLMRVNITPVSKDPDTAPALRPLSLLASAEELDRDFSQAMQMWSAPRRSLLDQVAAAAEQDEEENTAAATGSKSASKEAKNTKPAPKAGKQQSKTAESAPAAKPSTTSVDTGADGETPKPQAESAQPSPAANAAGGSAAAPVGTDEPPKGATETIPSSALEKDWQTTPASNQPPPATVSDAGKTASTPTPAAQSGGAFSDIEF